MTGRVWGIRPPKRAASTRRAHVITKSHRPALWLDHQSGPAPGQLCHRCASRNPRTTRPPWCEDKGRASRVVLSTGLLRATSTTDFLASGRPIRRGSDLKSSFTIRRASLAPYRRSTDDPGLWPSDIHKGANTTCREQADCLPNCSQIRADDVCTAHVRAGGIWLPQKAPPPP